MKTDSRKKKAASGKFFALLALAALLAAAAFVACEMDRLLPYGGGRDDGLEVPITRLTIEQSRIISQLDSGFTMQLGLDIFPPHTTMPEKVRWRSSDPGVVTVDEYTGEIKVVLENLRPGDSIFAEATVRAYFTENYSVFGEMTVMVLPEFPRTREVLFNWGQTAQENGTPLARLAARGAEQVNLEGDWHLGDGIILLTGTGDVSTEELQGRGTELVLQADSENLGSDPWVHTSAFLIDPNDPYAFIPRSTGGGRPLGSLHIDGAAINDGRGQPWNDPRRESLDPWGEQPDVIRLGHIRTAGAGMRAFQVLGLERPFEIEMRYVTNNANMGRWAGILFGGDEGSFWVEGPMSWQTASGAPAGSGHDTGRVIRFEFRDYLYSYNQNRYPDGTVAGPAFREWILRDGTRVPQADFVEDDPANPRIPLDDFLAITHIYAFEGLRIHDLVVRPLLNSDDPYDFDWGDRPPQ